MPLIYVFDYDADIADVLCQWLTLNGFEVKDFTKPQDLISNLKVRTPDCMILDSLYGGVQVTMDLCNMIQNVFNYKGRILLSTTGNVSDKELLECDAVDLIHKPFDIVDILDKVNKLFADSLAQ